MNTHGNDFKPPNYKHIIGDPITHMQRFISVLILQGNNDLLCCKLFLGTLGDKTLQWFNEMFMERFKYNCALRKEMESLWLIRQKDEKEISFSLSRFREEVAKI